MSTHSSRGPRGIRRQILTALKNTNKEITNNSSVGGMYARGLASEGYAGGYRDALHDVLSALDGNHPHRYPYWPRESTK